MRPVLKRDRQLQEVSARCTVIKKLQVRCTCQSFEEMFVNNMLVLACCDGVE